MIAGSLRHYFEHLSSVILICLLITYHPVLNAGNHAATGSSHHSDSIEIVRLTGTIRDLIRTAEFDKARQRVDSVYRIAKKMDWEKKVGDCYFNYGLIERRRGNLDGFFENLERAIEIYSSQNAWTEAARTHTAIAQVYIDLTNYQSAYQHFTRSLQLRELSKDTLGITNNLINIGNLYYLEGYYADASEYFFKALRLADEAENKNLEAIALMNMGNVFIAQRNYEKAVEYLQKSLQYHRAGNYRREEAKVLHNLGNVYLELDDFTTAKGFYLEAKTINEELNADMPGLANIYNNLGLIAKREGKPEEALKYYHMVVDLSRQTGNIKTEATALNNLGSLYIELQKPEALSLILQSLDIAKQMDLRRLMLSNYDNLRLYYKKSGNFKKAHDYAILYQRLNDSIFYDESAAKIIELLVQYDIELKEKANNLLTSENEMRKQNQRFSLIIIIILSLMLTSALWAFLLKRKSLIQNRKLLEKEIELSKLKIETFENQNQFLKESLFAEEEIKKLQKQSIEQKEAQLTSLAMLIANKNEVFQKLRKLAETIKGKASDDSISEARHMIKEIDRQTDFEKQWEHFKIHFESLHNSFFEKLMQKGICLTQTDFQLCAFIKLNLSTKEISRLMNIAPGSVNKHRYRLRKKLRLTADQMLDDFLRGL